MFVIFLRVCVIAAALSTAAASMAGTVEVSLQGLNCALCSDSMKAQLKHMSGAEEVLPRLECGLLFLEMAPGARVNELSLGLALQSNGFTMKSVKPTNMSLAEARDLSC